MPHPEKLPDLFLDRSLGRIQVPRLLREAGLRLQTLAERYGIPADEAVPDTTWLADAGRRGEAVLMKDTRVRYNPLEKAAVHEFKVRCFCLVRQDLSAQDMADRFIRNLPSIEQACREPGPFLYAVHKYRIEPLPID